MVAEFCIGFGSTAAPMLGTYTNKRLMARQPVAMADTVTFSHQPAATAAAPQFGVGWKTWATRGLVALTLGTTTPLVTSCEKGDQIGVIDKVPFTPTALGLVPQSGTTESVLDTEGGTGYSHGLEITAVSEGNLESFLKDPEGPDNRRYGHGAYIETPINSYDPQRPLTTIGAVTKEWYYLNGKVVFNSPIPFTSKTTITLGTAGSVLPPGKEKSQLPNFTVGDMVKDTSTLIAKDNVFRYLTFTFNNPNGSYKEVNSLAPTNRTDIIPYSTLATEKNEAKAKTTITNLVQNKLFLPKERADLFLSTLNSPAFNEATENNNQLKALALAMASADPTNETYDALVGNKHPRIYLTLVAPRQGGAETKVVTIDDQKAYKSFLNPDVFTTIDPLAARPLLYGHEVLETGNTTLQTAKREQIVQSMIQDYLYLKALAQLPFNEAKALFEQTNLVVKGYNMNLAAQLGSDPLTLRQRLSQSDQLKLFGVNITNLFQDRSYYDLIKRAYGSQNDGLVPAEAPVINFITAEFGVDAKRMLPATIDDAFIVKLQAFINEKRQKDGHWKVFYRLAQLAPFAN